MTSAADFADRFLLTDQVAIITGAGKGIGAAIATTFAAAGADVVLTARTEEDLEAVAADVRALGRRALVLPGNVNDLTVLANIVDRTISEFGRIDSCFAILADSLNTLKSKRKVIHKYAHTNAGRDGTTPTFRGEWEILK